jgi:hypothetical protein
LSKRKPHGGDFLLLIDDDLLRDASKLFILSVAPALLTRPTPRQ